MRTVFGKHRFLKAPYNLIILKKRKMPREKYNVFQKHNKSFLETFDWDLEQVGRRLQMELRYPYN